MVKQFYLQSLVIWVFLVVVVFFCFSSRNNFYIFLVAFELMGDGGRATGG